MEFLTVSCTIVSRETTVCPSSKLKVLFEDTKVMIFLSWSQCLVWGSWNSSWKWSKLWKIPHRFFVAASDWMHCLHCFFQFRIFTVIANVIAIAPEDCYSSLFYQDRSLKYIHQCSIHQRSKQLTVPVVNFFVSLQTFEISSHLLLM